MPKGPVWEVDTAALEPDSHSAEQALSEKARRLLTEGWEPFAVSQACM